MDPIIFPAIQAAAAVYLIFLGVILDTSNVRSANVFKFFPIIFAFLTGVDALIRLGVING